MNPIHQATEEFNEYAVEIDGVGFAASSSPFQLSVGHVAPDVFNSRAEAGELAEKLRADYRRLGAALYIDRIQIRSRTVTVTRGDWQ